MRNAEYVRADAQNALNARYEDLVKNLTNGIESACRQGKFHFTGYAPNLDTDTKQYLKNFMQDELGYGISFLDGDQRDPGTTIQVSW